MNNEIPLKYYDIAEEYAEESDTMSAKQSLILWRITSNCC